MLQLPLHLHTPDFSQCARAVLLFALNIAAHQLRFPFAVAESVVICKSLRAVTKSGSRASPTHPIHHLDRQIERGRDSPHLLLRGKQTNKTRAYF